MPKSSMKFSVSLWQRVRRTPYQTVAAVIMIAVTLFVISVFLILASASSSILSYFETKPQITVFFKEDQETANIDALVAKLKSTNKLASHQYVSKEQALKIYQEQNRNDPLLLEMVTADILPASLELFATAPQYLAEIAEIVKKEPGVDEVVFQKEIVDTLVSWTSTIRKVGIVFILFLMISSLMIIMTTIGMKIANRKDEIEILKLVGATSWNIKKPFILEGVSYGVIGATVAWAISAGIIFYLQPFISSFLQGLPPLLIFKLADLNLYIWPPNISITLVLWLTLMFAGCIIGFFGSLFAVSRYMKY